MGHAVEHRMRALAVVVEPIVATGTVFSVTRKHVDPSKDSGQDDDDDSGCGC